EEKFRTHLITGLFFFWNAFFRMKRGTVIHQGNLADRQAQNLPDLLDRKLANADEMLHLVILVTSCPARKTVPCAKPVRMPEHGHVMHGDHLWDRRRSESKQIS